MTNISLKTLKTHRGVSNKFESVGCQKKRYFQNPRGGGVRLNDTAIIGQK